jgi:hypothetical protein
LEKTGVKPVIAGRQKDAPKAIKAADCSHAGAPANELTQARISLAAAGA